MKSTRLERTVKDPIIFATLTLLLAIFYQWPRRWLISGQPLLQFFILAGDVRDYRVLPSFHLWPLFTTLHLIYAICSTSWLLYYVFAAICYPACFLVCLFQFVAVGDFARKNSRRLLKQLHFIDDKIAFFDIPALEIDTEVDGLMVLRGITFSLSSLSFVVHGVEVGIKLSDDMELAIQSEMVKVKLFRGVEIGDCFANLKGGQYEMTFGQLEGSTKDADGDAVFAEGTALLKAASREGDTRSSSSVEVEKVKMMDQMTDGSPPEDVVAKEGLKGMKKLSPDNEEANGRYQKMVKVIEETNCIYEVRQYVKKITKKVPGEERGFDSTDDNAVRAAICSQLHSKPSVPHPPQRSIKVTTLQNLAPPYIRGFMHRLPMLLRLLLNPLNYFHPVKISSITATASGRWIDSMLVEKVFLDYADQDHEIANLKKRISSWLSYANFAVGLSGITGIASVPFIPTYDIRCQLVFDDVMSYRALPAQLDLKQVIRLGGADATFIVPSFLLPHHEHLLPPVPSKDHKSDLEKQVDEADGKPKIIQAEHELKQAKKDETNVKLSVHARLPACFDQELLDFIAALVKATKVVEMEKVKEREESDMEEQEVNGIVRFGKKVKGGLKDGVKRTVVGGVVNDRWIAKMVGKVTRKLETARGEVGYSGELPVPLGAYRTEGWVEREGEKLLP
ncbi:uncharacterized protein K444DRAFT_583158 [Hyaloscypha bicolor E]|uniref:Uncharacterized protein n=1 Tax=Hyaloscypha bicolor E TaxID=1095630 RepID=A0A2J6TN69_9HELO|nr:uncharacterized protein K444DRAFT_583158 [Hyaloscypha bicolor E]PMD64460.1 hypothetical protein K444DRAFT_583158 [Hyaloscypha bicolor E]